MKIRRRSWTRSSRRERESRHTQTSHCSAHHTLNILSLTLKFSGAKDIWTSLSHRDIKSSVSRLLQCATKHHMHFFISLCRDPLTDIVQLFLGRCSTVGQQVVHHSDHQDISAHVLHPDVGDQSDSLAREAQSTGYEPNFGLDDSCELSVRTSFFWCPKISGFQTNGGTSQKFNEQLSDEEYMEEIR